MLASVCKVLRVMKTAKAKVFRRYCSHGLCTSNTVDKVNGVTFIRFPQPCDEYIKSTYDDSIKHACKKCEKVRKCLQWIHLCKRDDGQLQQLCDIERHSSVCSKHFAIGLRPTEMDPNTYPATHVSITYIIVA